MIRAMKNLIGRLSMPEDAHEYYDEYWVPVIGIPDYLQGKMTLTNSHPFNYRKIEQTRFGFWVQSNTWIGLNSELKMVNSNK
jgi:hypothetical protein